MGNKASSRSDVPQPGTEHHFRIKEEWSNTFTVYEGSEEDGAADNKGDLKKWMLLKHSNDLDDKGGTVSLELIENDEGEDPLLVMEVSEATFLEDACEKYGEKAWNPKRGYQQLESKKVEMVWEIVRTVKAYAGSETVAHLNVIYSGIAMASRDEDEPPEDYNEIVSTAERERRRRRFPMTYQDDTPGKAVVSKDCWASTQEVDMELFIGDERAEVQHSLGLKGDDTSSSDSYKQTYTVLNPGIEIRYNENWSKDTVHVKTSPEAEPLTALGMGFVMAYWMHPRRIEDDAERRVKDKLRNL